MITYKVNFEGLNGSESVLIESPHTLGCDSGDVADDLIDLAIEIGYLTLGEDFQDRLDTYAIWLEVV